MTWKEGLQIDESIAETGWRDVEDLRGDGEGAELERRKEVVWEFGH